MRRHEAVIIYADGWSWKLSAVQFQAQLWGEEHIWVAISWDRSSLPEFPAAGLMGGSPGCGEDVGWIQMICPLAGCDWDRGEGCYHWCVSHPETSSPSPPPPPPLPALHVACVCILACASWWGIGVGTAWKIYIWSHETCVCVCYSARCEHPCVVCACVAGKAAVSHPQASVACYHGSQAAGTPPPRVPNLFFFFKSRTHLSSLSSSSSSNSSSSLSSLTHAWLPPHRLWHHCPPPNAVLWWIILYVETSSTERQGQTWMSPVHSWIQTPPIASVRPHPSADVIADACWRIVGRLSETVITCTYTFFAVLSLH